MGAACGPTVEGRGQAHEGGLMAATQDLVREGLPVVMTVSRKIAERLGGTVRWTTSRG